ncbi:oxygen-dependent coproporphyrinogen oxidase [Flavobacteriales bacterium]|nr:oxygen-dependent coproporphyrinogen oxidase [Flavobacteriales bacterium]
MAGNQSSEHKSQSTEPMMDTGFLSMVQDAFRTVQNEQVAALMAFDDEVDLTRDHWKRESGGGGDTRILKEGKVIEKGGLNFSAVEGDVTPALAQQLDTSATRFAATGVSSVLHPCNPHVPIIHMNVRYFTLDDGTWWFGGGIDLTPHYIVPAQARAFHSELKAICDRHAVADYSVFKPWADRYFSLPHRNESRGVGGIFFDHIGRDGSIDREEVLAFCVDLSSAYASIYKERAAPFFQSFVNADDMHWQGLRRGRYVEFNLVHDRGTRFGLVSGGRTESILMSLPSRAHWEYDHQPPEGSPQADTLAWLRQGVEGVDWLGGA